MVSMAACGGHNPVAAVTGSSENITETDVSPLGAHFSGSVTADQWELSNLGGKLSGWLAKDIQAAQ